MEKIFISGSIIEVYEYEKSFVGKGGHLEKIDERNNEKNYKLRVVHRRDMVRRLVCANFNSETVKFLTLTFDDKKVTHDIRDVKQCNNEFKKFIKRLKYYLKIDDLQYVAVIEFQDKNGRGAIHYHCLINMPNIPFLELQKIWGKGFIFIENVKHVDNLGAYLVKYMTKENADTRLQKEKAYLTSRNLDRPFEFSFRNVHEYKKFEKDILKEKYNYNSREPVFQSTYDTEMLGQCRYTQYNLNRT